MDIGLSSAGDQVRTEPESKHAADGLTSKPNAADDRAFYFLLIHCWHGTAHDLRSQEIGGRQTWTNKVLVPAAALLVSLLQFAGCRMEVQLPNRFGSLTELSRPRILRR